MIDYFIKTKNMVKQLYFQYLNQFILNFKVAPKGYGILAITF